MTTDHVLITPMWPLCLVLILTQSCGPGFGAARGGAAGGSFGRYPITDGFRKALPHQGARVVIWGGHPSATGTAINWLQRRGLRVVERAQIHKIFQEQKIQLTHTPDDEADLLRVGSLVGADLIVFLDTPIASGNQATGGSFITPYGGSSQARSATVFSTSIWVRGVDVETGELLWSATGRYATSSANLDDVLVRLTCHALATAWGYRPAGKIDRLGDMCMLGDEVN